MEQQLNHFLETLKADQGRADNTIAAYRNDLTQFITFIRSRLLDPVEPATVTPDLLDAYVSDLQNGAGTTYAPSTIARKVAAVKSFFHFLIQHNVISVDPSARITSPKVKKQTPRVLSRQEIEQLLAAAARIGGSRGQRDSALLTFLYATGLRVTEVVNVKLEDVNWEAGTVACPGKGGRERLVPLGAAQNLVADYLKNARPTLTREASPPMLFLNHRGQKLTRQGVWLIIKEAAKLAEISDLVTPHTLRHSFAKHLLTSGESVRRVQELLGHANLSTTQIYRTMPAESQPETTP